MKSYLGSALAMGFLALTACSSGGSGSGGGGNGVAQSFDANPLKPANFTEEKTLTKEEYEKLFTETKNTSICTDSEAFRGFAKGDTFVFVGAETLGTALRVEYRTKMTVESVQDTELKFLDVFENVFVPNFSGQILNSDSSNRTCTIRNSFSNCDGGLDTTEEFKNFVEAQQSSKPKPEADCEFKNGKSSDHTYDYAQGTFTLENGSRVNALLVKEQSKYSEICPSGTKEYTKISVSIYSGQVKDEAGTCAADPATLYSYRVEQDAGGGVISQEIKKTLAAPTR